MRNVGSIKKNRVGSNIVSIKMRKLCKLTDKMTKATTKDRYCNY